MNTERDVNVRLVERDLHTLWEEMAKTNQAEGHQAIMRVCVLNLMVVTPGEDTAGEVSQIMAHVTTQHPSRIFVILPKYGASEPDLSAWVTALCHLSAGGHKQVCCEQIMIAAGESALYRIPSLVRPLLVPDLPVVLWWRDVPNFDSRLFAELVQASDRVILDSARFQDPEEGLATLATLINHERQWTAFSDLSWSRLTPWRLSVAGLLDVPDWRAHLSRLTRVEIDFAGASGSHRPISSEALLIVSWLASRLQWHVTSEPRRRSKDTYQLGLVSNDLAIDVEIKSAPSAVGIHGGLHALRLIAEGTPSPEFVVSRSEEDGVYLQAHVELAGTTLAGKIVRLGSHNEAELISKELEILGRDALFEESLAFLASIPR